MSKFEAETGAAYVFIAEPGAKRFELIPIIHPNTVHMLWQVPQFFCMTVGEVGFFVLQFLH